VATGATLEEMEQQIKEAISLRMASLPHFTWIVLARKGLPIPEPTTLCEYVEACWRAIALS
jgi:predicted RNase H-like HicB family nuclease